MVNAVLPTTVRLAELAAEVLSVPLERIPDNSGHAHFGGPSGWIHGLSNKRIDMYRYPLIRTAIEELADRLDYVEPAQVLINELAPGTQLSAHRDGLPSRQRYHLPVVTNSDAYWWDEFSDMTHMSAGWWYGPVPYCGILHSAGNSGSTARVHLVVDFS